ncbi:MAG: hypothetical protein ACRBFS_14450 [Aureispira sp.]
MRTLFFLLCTLPVLCLGQSPSNAAASIQHQQALQQLQQQEPRAKVVNLDALAAQQGQEHRSCSSCAKKAALANQPSSPVHLASKDDLLTEIASLVSTIEVLRQSDPIEVDLIRKYRRALEIRVAELKVVEAAEIRQAKEATSKR